MTSSPLIKWFELPATDIQRAQSFYETILGIEMKFMDLGEEFKMALFPGEEAQEPGALVYNSAWYKPSGTHGPLLYFDANPDLQDALDKVEELGGKIMIPKRQISEDRGFMSVIEDSEGNRIALRSDA